MTKLLHVEFDRPLKVPASGDYTKSFATSREGQVWMELELVTRHGHLFVRASREHAEHFVPIERVNHLIEAAEATDPKTSGKPKLRAGT